MKERNQKKSKKRHDFLILYFAGKRFDLFFKVEYIIFPTFYKDFL